MAHSYEYKIIPLNRRSRKPAIDDPTTVMPQLTVKMDLLYDVMNQVNPSVGIQKAIISKDMDRDITIRMFAQILSEQLGADVYYRKVDTPDSEPWRKYTGGVW